MWFKDLKPQPQEIHFLEARLTDTDYQANHRKTLQIKKPFGIQNLSGFYINH